MNLPKPFEGYKPMRACSAPDDLNEILYPCLAQPKLDGITAHILCDNRGEIHVFSNTLKYTPNIYLQDYLCEMFKPHMRPATMLSAELVHKDGFQATQSMVMSKLYVPAPNMWTCNIFDALDFREPNDTYLARKARVIHSFSRWRPIDTIRFMQDIEVADSFSLSEMLKMCANLGHEGLMIRSVLGSYKYGDVTQREGYVMKLKPFEDDEAIIVGLEEAHYLDGAPKGTLGAFRLRHKKFGEFTCSGELTAKQKQSYWNEPEKVIGQTGVFKYLKIGTKDKPREPIFKGVRYDKA